jgi:hypothetical protein
MPLIREGLEIKKIHERQGVKGLYLGKNRIRLKHQKPEDFYNFRKDKNDLGYQHNVPAVGVGDAISEGKAPNPDKKCNKGEFDQVNQGDGKILECRYRLEHAELSPFVKDLKSSNLVFNKIFFDK